MSPLFWSICLIGVAWVCGKREFFGAAANNYSYTFTLYPECRFLHEPEYTITTISFTSIGVYWLRAFQGTKHDVHPR